MAIELRRVTFPHGEVELVGDLRLPDGPAGARPAIVLATPGSSVRGQIGAVYGEALAAEGFVTLAFDPAHQGESGGEPRDLEDPATRVEDLACALDHLVALPEVDAGRLGMLGICAGGGYAVQAAKVDHRVRALGAVVPVDIGRARRQASTSEPGAVVASLEAVGAQRTAEARGGALRRDPWIPDTPEAAVAAGVTDREVLDAVDFYRTPRGLDPASTNRLLHRSLAPLTAFDPFALVGELLTQPVQVVVGGRRGSTGSYDDGLRLWERARAAEPLLVVEGAGHYDLYDRPAFVGPAVARLAAFFARVLRAA